MRAGFTARRKEHPDAILEFEYCSLRAFQLQFISSTISNHVGLIDNPVASFSSKSSDL